MLNNKIEELNSLCQNNYQKVSNFFGNDINIRITKEDGTVILDCSPIRSLVRPLFVTNRLAILNSDNSDDDNEIVRVDIEVIG